MAAPTAANGWNTVPQKLVVSAFGILFFMFVTYLAWLGITVARLDRTSTDTAAAVKSLTERRMTGAEQLSTANEQRINTLEEAKPKGDGQ